MARSIPPLNPLLAFEAAARHGSFARAAAELSVTPTAISRQVKMLENYFGTEFFDREPGGVQLTPEAREYAAHLSRAFRQIATATDDFRANHASSILTISGYTTFLVKWLVPKLPAFQKRFPHIKVRLVTSSAAGAARTDADIAILYGENDWPGLQAMLLFNDELVPVGSPALLAEQPAGRGRAQGGASPADIAQRVAAMPLLQLEARRNDWLDWFELAKVAPPKNGFQSFEDLGVVLESARSGLGVALVQRAYVEENLAHGDLAIAAPITLRRSRGYYALAGQGSAAKSKVKSFFDWLAAYQARPADEPDGAP
ncbi:transcriptional regulator [Achromobacter pulmonis]|uniref:Transcriptional regulator n=1 Tax=Achromobacter pulmonis TaxID=1389932 RepID=A0A2N8KJH9_9BURK|nr:LysR substrate-binding domain-containing protein [Achromobacter pulmonis]PND33612.1 transcriptional regulator [Achromobacter pulmonis]